MCVDKQTFSKYFILTIIFTSPIYQIYKEISTNDILCTKSQHTIDMKFAVMRKSSILVYHSWHIFLFMQNKSKRIGGEIQIVF